jgi:hypothetical protein
MLKMRANVGVDPALSALSVPPLCNIKQAFTNIHVSPMRFIQANAGA